MALVLAATGMFLSTRLRSDLDHTLDQGLRSRAVDVTALVEQADTGLREGGGGRASEPGADFAQILDARSGGVFDATPGLQRRPLLSPGELLRARRGTVLLEHPAATGRIRLLATPVRAQGRRLVVIVGASLEDRDEALANLHTLLLIGGPAALLLASLAGYGLTSAALRPVDSMRRRAASISTEHVHHRLPLSGARDELRRLGETLNEMLDRLEGGLERERAFAADAGHELRTPLTMLKTELQLMARDRPRGAALDRAVAAAIDEADRLTALIDDLLVLARADSDLPPTLGDVAVDELVAAVVARSAPGRIAVDVPAGAGVRADRAQLERALGNLVANALRHGGGSVRIGAQLRGALVELRVRDDGPGFPPELLPRAFDRFARSDQARTGAGAGLGLAIVDAIARAHGGSAHVANHPEGGADAWIVVPAAAHPVRSAPHAWGAARV